jgi:4-hydroxymandelate oxidase
MRQIVPRPGWYTTGVRTPTDVEMADVADGANTFTTLDEITRAAHKRLSEGQLAYLEGGSGDEQALRANRAAFERWGLLPAPLSNTGRPDTRTSLLGIELRVPFVVGPVGPYSVFHPDGDIAVARAAERAGTIALIPVLSAHPLETTRARAPSGACVFQVLASGSEDACSRLMGRAAAAGYAAICVTIDAFPRSYRDRVDASGFELSPDSYSANYGAELADEIAGHINIDAPGWTWQTLERVIAGAPLPVIVKGVLTAEAARAAVAAGAVGVVVSNVGGRQLEAAPSTLSQLPTIVAAVGDEVEVIIDSGIRRGADIVKALALGAKAALLGRVVARGLAAGGELGVERALDLLRSEVEVCMALCGCRDVAAIDGSVVTPAS